MALEGYARQGGDGHRGSLAEISGAMPVNGADMFERQSGRLSVAKEWMPKPSVSAYACICNKDIKENTNAGFEETQMQPDCIGWIVGVVLNFPASVIIGRMRTGDWGAPFPEDCIGRVENSLSQFISA
ncbi:MAG: hypothetical protein AB1437_14045 [Pseudomonadota bacterium]